MEHLRLPRARKVSGLQAAARAGQPPGVQADLAREAMLQALASDPAILEEAVEALKTL